MTIKADDFNAVMDEWKDWQAQPWGRLFYNTAHRNLQRHLSKGSLRILDVGGGNGVDSLYFAGLGHVVTLLDFSQAMLADARRSAEVQGLSEKITMVQADAGDVLHVMGEQRFDVVLCNLMIEFVADPPALLRDITSLLAPGGTLSLIDGNRYCEAFRTALLQNDLTAALGRVNTITYPHRWFNREVPIYTAEEIIQQLQPQGCRLTGQYGIWSVCPYLPNERKFEPQYYAELEQLEFCLSETYPYYLLARFFHLVLRKDA